MKKILIILGIVFLANANAGIIKNVVKDKIKDKAYDKGFEKFKEKHPDKENSLVIKTHDKWGKAKENGVGYMKKAFSPASQK